MRKAQVDGYTALLFLWKAIRIIARQSFNERTLAVINVAGGRQNSVLFLH